MSIRFEEDYISLSGHLEVIGNLYPSYASVTAHAGGGRANATALADFLNHISVCASDNDSVKLPQYPVCSGGSSGPFMWVINKTAHICDVYPYAAGDQIDALGAGNPYSLGAGFSRRFAPTGASTWMSW